MLSINPALARVPAPPISQAARWAQSYDGRAGPLINLSQAVPGNAPPDDLARRLGEAAASAEGARYGAVLGDGVLREAYAAHVSSLYDAAVSPEEVAVTAGCNQAFFVAVMAVAGAGDAVILPTPFYFNHQMTLDMLGVEIRPLATRPEDGFVPTLDGLKAAMSPRVKAVALVTPNNPTGAIYPPETIEAIYDFCAANGLWLILDETYRDFLPAGNRAPHGLFAKPDWREHLIELYSFSKSYAIPGHRMGAMAGGAPFLAEAEKVLDSLQICAPRPPQAVLAWAIGGLAAYRRTTAAEIEARAGVFRRAMAPHPDWRIEQLGAYFAYVRHPFAGIPAATVAERLARELGIVTLPGTFFGPGQENHLRIAFANVASERLGHLGERLSLAPALFATDAVHG
ncbi:aspartate/tyrosine/aromatic aminotransferase [Aureimonas sp. Leaf454]|uniref:aminotransferase n=1 Tax=Aureimonas sp. Leaf454 TaxID=1736381 RepID=UPI0006FF1DE2|nr:aminotransferase [Aureimonas sp. Leaf454]KQT50957.1 aspartate/tyrosine/aromatic aminotransferase [Aureimonas sp. Leaf454]